MSQNLPALRSEQVPAIAGVVAIVGLLIVFLLRRRG